ncbi:MAG: hypothetical protein MRERV_18c021 [Mycoplasmataceae bacterium RV_VA103A]|nr:MAG: hypothetical protein MRERV_18c021 [Mycoplasmataceae bacterium RV_VA103A]
MLLLWRNQSEISAFLVNSLGRRRGNWIFTFQENQIKDLIFLMP